MIEVKTRQGRVIIEISGGNIMGVYSTYPRNLRVIIVDHDTAEVTDLFPVQHFDEFHAEEIMQYDRRVKS